MTSHVKVPIIFPLSNPTSLSEADPADLLKWTNAKAIIATGSPFEPVVFRKKTYEIAQCNNVHIFPGVGLGSIISKADSISPLMFLKAAEVVAKNSPYLSDPQASLFPRVEEIRAVSREVAIEVAKTAIEEGLSEMDPSEVEKAVDAHIWIPHYPKYERQ